MQVAPPVVARSATTGTFWPSAGCYDQSTEQTIHKEGGGMIGSLLRLNFAFFRVSSKTLCLQLLYL